MNTHKLTLMSALYGLVVLSGCKDNSQFNAKHCNANPVVFGSPTATTFVYSTPFSVFVSDTITAINERESIEFISLSRNMLDAIDQNPVSNDGTLEIITIAGLIPVSQITPDGKNGRYFTYADKDLKKITSIRLGKKILLEPQDTHLNDGIEYLNDTQISLELLGCSKTGRKYHVITPNYKIDPILGMIEADPSSSIIIYDTNLNWPYTFTKPNYDGESADLTLVKHVK